MNWKKERHFCNHSASEETKGLTRRDLLRYGGACGLGMTTLSPLVAGLLRHSETLAGGKTPIKVPVLHIHAAGGHGGGQWFVARDASGDTLDPSLLPSFAVPVGQASVSNGIYSQLGAPLWYLSSDRVNPISQFTAALIQNLTPSATTNSSLVAIPNRSGNDNTSGAQYGLLGAFGMAMENQNVAAAVTQSIGLTNATSGNGTMNLVNNPRLARLFPLSVQDIITSASISKVLGFLGTPVLRAFAQRLAKFNEARFASLGNSDSVARFANVQRQATGDYLDRVIPLAGTDPTSMNPANDSLAASILGITATPDNFATSTSSQDLQWTLIYNLLRKNFAMGSFTLGGYDYHGNTYASTMAKDAQLGALLGKIHSLADAMGVPLYTFVSTDGGVQSTGTTGPQGSAIGSYWAGDDTNYTLAFTMLTWPGSGRPSQTQTMLGNWDETTGHTNPASLVGSAALTTAAVLANALNLNGMLGALNSILIAAKFPDATIEQITKNALTYG